MITIKKGTTNLPWSPYQQRSHKPTMVTISTKGTTNLPWLPYQQRRPQTYHGYHVNKVDHKPTMVTISTKKTTNLPWLPYQQRGSQTYHDYHKKGDHKPTMVTISTKETTNLHGCHINKGDHKPTIINKGDYRAHRHRITGCTVLPSIPLVYGGKSTSAEPGSSILKIVTVVSRTSALMVQPAMGCCL